MHCETELIEYYTIGTPQCKLYSYNTILASCSIKPIARWVFHSEASVYGESDPTLNRNNRCVHRNSLKIP